MSNTPSVFAADARHRRLIQSTTPVEIATCAAVTETWNQYFSETHTKSPLTSVLTAASFQRVACGLDGHKVVSHTRTRGPERGAGAGVPPGCEVVHCLPSPQQPEATEIGSWTDSLSACYRLLACLTASKRAFSFRKKLSFMSTLLSAPTCQLQKASPDAPFHRTAVITPQILPHPFNPVLFQQG